MHNILNLLALHHFEEVETEVMQTSAWKSFALKTSKNDDTGLVLVLICSEMVLNLNRDEFMA